MLTTCRPFHNNRDLLFLLGISNIALQISFHRHKFFVRGTDMAISQCARYFLDDFNIKGFSGASSVGSGGQLGGTLKVGERIRSIFANPINLISSRI